MFHEKFFITADDWGLSPAINEAIVHLAQEKIVTRVSMMVKRPFFHHRLGEIVSLPWMRFGLHFEIKDLSIVSFYHRFILSSSFRKKLPQELEEQFELLMSHVGRVDYFDSHQNIHALPFVMRILAKMVEEYTNHIRHPFDSKQLLSRKFLLPLVSIFMPKYSFHSYPFFYPKVTNSFNAYVRQWLKQEGKECLVHPANAADFSQYGVQDEYEKPRIKEYEYLIKLKFFFKSSI